MTWLKRWAISSNSISMNFSFNDVYSANRGKKLRGTLIFFVNNIAETVSPVLAITIHQRHFIGAIVSAIINNKTGTCTSILGSIISKRAACRWRLLHRVNFTPIAWKPTRSCSSFDAHRNADSCNGKERGNPRGGRIFHEFYVSVGFIFFTGTLRDRCRS